jgi:transcriptional regulator of heat shock response
MKTKGLTPKEMVFLKTQYLTAGQKLEELLHTTLKVAATLSHLLAVVTVPNMPFKVLSSGLTNIADQPEFRDSDHIRNILDMIEHEDEMEELTGELTKDSSLTIKIGSEIKHKKIRDCSIVISRYELPRNFAGTISIIGPTRMTYDKVSSIVETVSKTLKEMLTEGMEID